MGIPPSIHAYWRAFTSTIGHDPLDRFYEAFHFDDNAPSADELAALRLEGYGVCVMRLTPLARTRARQLPGLNF